MTNYPLQHRWPLKLLAFCLIGAVATFWWLLDNQQVMRTEARARFFEQYNTQQLLLAQQASRTIEELFATLRRNLGIVASLFADGPVTLERAEEVSASLKRIYGLIDDMPIIDLVVFDKDGLVVGIVPEDPYTLGRDYSWRSYFKWAANEGKPGKMYLSPFLQLEGGQKRGGKALIVAGGIYSEVGEFEGVAMFTLNFDDFARSHVMNIAMGETGYAWLVDSNNGTVLVDPAGRVTGQSFEEAFGERWPVLKELLDSTKHGVPGMSWYEFEDSNDPKKSVRKLVGYSPIRFENQLWTLGVCTPERDVERVLASYFRKTKTFSTTALVTVFGGSAILMGLLLGWNRTLKDAVLEHTERLEDAQTRLESTFEELLSARKVATVGNMALGLVHEVRNPLSAIRMNMQMLKKRMGSDESATEHFSIMEGEISRLNRLLGDVMSFARPHKPKRDEVDLELLINDILLLSEERFKKADIEVETQCAPGLPAISCDREQMTQMILNLILNAVEAMEDAPGPRVLTLALLPEEGEEGSIVLRVGDTGPGIDPENRDKIFEPFYTAKAKGLGLGLSIVEAIIARHGGEIVLDDEVACGTSFSVTLPIKNNPDKV